MPFSDDEEEWMEVGGTCIRLLVVVSIVINAHVIDCTPDIGSTSYNDTHKMIFKWICTGGKGKTEI